MPWYLLSCFALADQDISLYMHGASGHTPGRLYTEDVLQQLNIPVAENWQAVRQQLDQTNFAFMPLEFMCPELQRIIDLRSYLGLRSPVHTLSRLLNPLRATHSMQSIFHPSYGDSHQQAAIALGQENAAVFKGEGGEIERRPEASCAVKVVTEGKASEEFWPKMVEGRQALPESLNVQDLIAVWRGEKEVRYALDAIIGTLAIALSLLNKADNQQQAMSLAQSYWQKRNKNRL